MLKLYSSDARQVDRRGTVTLKPKAPSIQSSLKKLELQKETVRGQAMEQQRVRDEYMKKEKKKLFALLKALNKQIKQN